MHDGARLACVAGGMRGGCGICVRVLYCLCGGAARRVGTSQFTFSLVVSPHRKSCAASSQLRKLAHAFRSDFFAVASRLGQNIPNGKLFFEAVQQATTIYNFFLSKL